MEKEKKDLASGGLASGNFYSQDIKPEIINPLSKLSELISISSINKEQRLEKMSQLIMSCKSEDLSYIFKKFSERSLQLINERISDSRKLTDELLKAKKILETEFNLTPDFDMAISVMKKKKKRRKAI